MNLSAQVFLFGKKSVVSGKQAGVVSDFHATP